MPILQFGFERRPKKKPSARLIMGLLEAAFFFAVFAMGVCILAGLSRAFG